MLLMMILTLLLYSQINFLILSSDNPVSWDNLFSHLNSHMTEGLATVEISYTEW